VPDIRRSTDDYVVTQTLVSAGLGVALLPALAVEAALGANIDTIALRRHASRQVGFSGPGDIPPSPAVAAAGEAIFEITKSRRVHAGG
jgi:DNA-binding transcriptional LysR family regulator